jgi:glycosyltransferase involved in cell wall biosynthesis
MKILHVVPSYKPAYIYGGTIESVARLCEGLVNAGEQVKVFTTTANGEEELDIPPNKEYNVDGVRVTYFKRIFKDPIYISPALWKRLYKECSQYDVVHIHSWWNILVIVAAFICKRKKVKTIISPHGMMSDYIFQNSNRVFKWLSHLSVGKHLLKYSLFHATSEAEFEECTQLLPGWKGFMIPNIVWLPQLEIEKPVHSTFTITFLSRIHPKKGIELLMEAISIMEIKPILKIAGTGEPKYIDKLKQKARSLNITDNVFWEGWQDREQKFKAFMEADLFALTSYNENFGNVVIEALHVGTPVIVSDKTGLFSFIKKYNLGWICKTTVEDIRLKLQEAINNVEQRNWISKCAPLIISDFFSEERLIQEYIKHYEQ